MSEEQSKNRTIAVTAITTAGIVAAVTMSIIAVAQTNDRMSSAQTMMYRQTPAAAAPSAAPKPSNASIVINHVIHGCHAMSVNGQMNMSPNATLRLTPGSTLNVTDNDVMPHRLVQLAGPAAVMSGAAMTHMGAKSAVTFSKPGTYSLTTKAGEDYPNIKAAPTVGEDNTLKIRVVVTA